MPSPYQPGPVPAPYAGAPAGLLRPSPMALGDVFSGVFELYKRRWPLFVGIALIPAAAMAVTLVVYFVSLLGVVSGMLSSRANADPLQLLGALFGGFLLYLVAVFFIAALQYKCYGMISLGAVDLANGSQPTLGSLSARTRGLGWRVLGVMLAIGAAVAVVYGIVAAIAVSILGGAFRSGRTPSSGDVGGAFALTVLLMIAFVVAAMFLSVRWLYFVPVLAIEGAGGFAALRRSWQLTSGSFWRTLGYYLVASLLLTTPSILVSSLSSAFGTSTRINDPATVLVPMLLVGLLSLAITVFTGPFLQLFTTVMYLDQLNRTAGAVAPVWGTGQPAWGTPQPWDAQQPAVAPPAWDPQQPAAQSPWGPAPGVTPGPAPAAYDPTANPYVPPVAPQEFTPERASQQPVPQTPDAPDLEATRRRSDLVPPPAWTPPQQTSEQAPPPQPPVQQPPVQQPPVQQPPVSQPQPPAQQPPVANPWARPVDPNPSDPNPFERGPAS